MAHDPELIAETRSWLSKAALDLASADHQAKGVPPFLADAVFHAQQAAEKSLKAFLTWHSTPFRKTHLLEEIGEQCLGIDQTLRQVVEKGAPLTQFAWKYRYPGDPVGTLGT